MTQYSAQLAAILVAILAASAILFSQVWKQLPTYFSLHLVVYVCYKFIYVRVIMCRKSFKSYIRKCTLMPEYPTHFQGTYKLKSRRHAKKYVFESRLWSFFDAFYIFWLTVQEKFRPIVGIFLQNWTKSWQFSYLRLWQRNWCFTKWKGRRNVYSYLFNFIGNSLSPKPKKKHV